MLSVTRILGFVCTFAFCNLTFPPPLNRTDTPPNDVPLVVQTNLGNVQGYYMSSMRGKLIGSFEGIPYAEPPVGNLRFQNPSKKRSWVGTLNAGKTSPVCIQMDPTQYYRVVGDEDCLYLNIYTPLKRTQTKNIPVFIWVHGGGFYWGAGSNSGPGYLLDRDVILITINYRLGPMGFLSTGDSAAPGNYGLKDQAMAIAWVHENIRYFGGDPNRITLGGQSAGAASVHLHMMSPQTKGKIQGAISQSGSALSHWGLPPNQQYYFKRLAKLVGCSSDNSAETVACLRQKSARELIYRQYNLFEWMEYPQILFGPVVEQDSPTAFITMKPKTYYERGLVANIPWITGVTKDEGDLFALVTYLGPLATRNLLRNIDKVLPPVLMYSPMDTKSTKKIHNFYLSQYPKYSYGGFETLGSLSQMVGDRFFYVPFHKTIRTHSESVHAPLYAYMFSFKGQHGTPEKFHLSPKEWGVLHMDELQYLLNSTELFAPMKLSDAEFEMAGDFMDLWVSFIKNGSPDDSKPELRELSNQHSWERYSRSNRKLLEITQTPRMIEEPNENRINFWKSINLY